MSSSSLGRINLFFKKVAKPAKRGIKVGKGLAAVSTKHTKNPSTGNIAVAIGQGAGIIIFPALFLIFSRLFTRIPKQQRKMLALSMPVGVTVGGYLGNLAANTLFSDLPSGLVGLFGIMSGVVLTTAVFAVAAVIHHKISSRRPNAAQSSPPAALLTRSRYTRLNAGLEAGALFGAAIGASLAFVNPSLGYVGAAVATVIAAPLGAFVFMLAPKLVARFQRRQITPQSDQATTVDKPNLRNFKTGMSIGALIGSALGIIIGSLILPGLGTVLGGIIGASIGGLLTGTVLALLPYGMNKLGGGGITPQQDKKISGQLKNMQTCMKTFAPIGAAIGAVLGSFVLPGVGTVAGAAMGGLLAAFIGSLVAAVPVFINQSRPRVEVPADTNAPEHTTPPFTAMLKKSKAIISLSIAIGGVLGGIAGSFLLPILGTSLGATIGAGLGAALAIGGCMLASKIMRHYRRDAERDTHERPAADQPHELADPDNSHRAINLRLASDTGALPATTSTNDEPAHMPVDVHHLQHRQNAEGNRWLLAATPADPASVPPTMDIQRHTY